MQNKITAIVQARMGSTRLPGKVLEELLPGKTLLSIMLTRIKQSKLVDQIIVATSNSKSNDAVQVEAQRNSVECFRGSGAEDDVLSRFVEAAMAFDAQNVVRLCADSPLHDGAIIDTCISEFLQRREQIDFLTNCLPETFPYGTAVEVFPIDVLLRLDRLSLDAFQREHVTQYFYQNTNLFKFHSVLNDVNLASKRWVIDTAEDLAFVKDLYSILGADKVTTDWREILKLSIVSAPENAESTTKRKSG